MTEVKPLNKKCREVLTKKGFLIVLEGAVRSGKTVTSLLRWYYYIISSPEKIFLMSGATMGSLSRNCLLGDFGLISISGGKAKQRTDNDGNHYLEIADKKIYYCGADNKRSYKKIQGMTIGGWYADEINNHDKEFVSMAMSRSFASTDRLNVWTLNPDAPGHWIYSEYIDSYQKSKIPGYFWYHFNLNDNSSLTAERKEEVKAQFTGIFYKRYILGLRVRAEGICYPSFDRDKHIVDNLPEIKFVQVGFDIGGNRSATSLTATGFYFEDKKMKMIALDEEYYTENKDVETVIKKYKLFVEKIKKKYNFADVFIDSAEQLILKTAKNIGIVNVNNSLKKPIIDRIRCTDMLFGQDRLHIYRKCVNLITSIESAVWDEKNEMSRLDNGTVNIDSLDSFEYSFESQMNNFTY